MGYEATCACTLGKQSGEGKAQLETDFIQFRSSEFRFKVRLKDLTRVQPNGEQLELHWQGGDHAHLLLGEAKGLFEEVSGFTRKMDHLI